MIWQYLFCLFKNSIFFVTFCIVKSACTCTHTTILEFSLLIFLKQSKRNGEHTRFCCCQAVLDCDPVCALWAQLLVDMVLPVQILQCWQCLGWEVLVCHLCHMGRALPKRGKGIYPQGEHFYFFPEDSWKNLSAWCILYIKFFFWSTAAKWLLSKKLRNNIPNFWTLLSLGRYHRRWIFQLTFNQVAHSAQVLLAYLTSTPFT